MTDFQTLLDGIDPMKKSPNKDQLWEFVKGSLEQIKEINVFYQELNQGVGGEQAIVQAIEEKFMKIKEAYSGLFDANEQGVNKIQELTQKIELIKQYHAQLLEGENSIKLDIEESQKHITDFYNFLFGDEDGQGSEQKTKEAIERITKFNNRLTSQENGIEVEIEKAYQNILQKHKGLFEAEEGESSRIEELEQSMEKIKKFDESLEKEIKPNIEEKQKYLDELKTDIDKKREDVNSLLESSTGGALVQGYRESMEEYSKRGSLDYKKAFGEKKWLPKIYKCLSTFIHNNFTRHVGVIVNHITFFLPLIVICLIFIEPAFIKELLNHGNSQVSFTGTEFILFKISVSLPLLWIAWFGQKNISHRKRLFEEYNHKLRVVQMYIMFTANGNTYNLAQKKELEGTLLAAINSNPAEHLGKGETMIDSILEKFYIAGFYKKLKKEILSEINPIKTDDN